MTQEIILSAAVAASFVALMLQIVECITICFSGGISESESEDEPHE